MVELTWGPSHTNGIPRRKRVHHKVKSGCTACKERRQKCDEIKPVCSACYRHSTECRYLSKQKSKDNHIQIDGSSTVLSPQRSLHSSPSTHINLGDLELFHHYLTSTCMTKTQLPEVTMQIQRNLPILAQSYPFLMRGMLGQAATHLSRLQPSQQAHYARLAAEHHNAALPEFRLTLQNLNQDNCQAVMYFSKKLLWCSMARYDPPGESIPMSSSTCLPQWFSLLLGSCQIVRRSRLWIKTGPFAMIKLDRLLESDQSSECQHLCNLMGQLPATTGSIYINALKALSEAFVLSNLHEHNTPQRNAVNFWIDSLSDEFVNMLQHKDPMALIILAHFCVLLNQSEEPWFMRGRSAQLLESIARSLDATWTAYVQWPCERLQVELT